MARRAQRDSAPAIVAAFLTAFGAASCSDSTTTPKWLRAPLTAGAAAQRAARPIPPNPPVVTTITVTPASTTITVGGVQSFSATVKDQNGNTMSTPVTWTTGAPSVATITSGGVATGVGAGNVAVVATAADKSGSASLDVTAALPPIDTASNEPAGTTVIADRAFNGVEEGWETQGPFTIATSTDCGPAPRSAPNVGQIRFPARFRSGSAPAQTGIPSSTIPIGNYGTLYIAFWACYSRNWQGESSGVNKQFFAWTGGLPAVCFSAQGTGSGPLQPQIRLQGGETANLPPNVVPSATFSRGAWHKVEVLLTIAGSVTWWIDYVKVGEYTGRNFGGTRWETFQWSPVWGGDKFDRVDAEQFLWWDHVYVSGQA